MIENRSVFQILSCPLNGICFPILVVFKNEESFETYKAIKESAKLEEELKNKKKGEMK